MNTLKKCFAIGCSVLVLGCAVQQPYSLKIRTQVDYSYWRPASFGNAAILKEKSVSLWSNDITELINKARMDADQDGGLETFEIIELKLIDVHIRPSKNLDTIYQYFDIGIFPEN